MARRTNKVVGEICLYGGNEATGRKAGWLAGIGVSAMAGRLGSLGNGELTSHGLTEAVWAACEALRDAGVRKGTAWVYAPGGQRRVAVDISHPGYYGQLAWESAPMYVLSAEAIMAAATPE